MKYTIDPRPMSLYDQVRLEDSIKAAERNRFDADRMREISKAAVKEQQKKYIDGLCYAIRESASYGNRSIPTVLRTDGGGADTPAYVTEEFVEEVIKYFEKLGFTVCTSVGTNTLIIRW